MTPQNVTLFRNWLASRRIVKKQERTGLCFDADLYAQNGSAFWWHKTSLTHYWLDNQEMACEFSSHSVETIEGYLDELEHYSVDTKRSKSKVKEFIKEVKQSGDTVEPVWSSTKIQDPAALLLPDEDRLVIEDSLPVIHNAYWSKHAHAAPKFRNNLSCIFGKWYFMANGAKIEIHNIDFFQEKNMFSNFKCAIKIDKNAEFEDEYTESLFGFQFTPSEDELEINYIKIGTLRERPVLISCIDIGLVLIYDIQNILAKYKRELKYHDRKYWLLLDETPLMAFRTVDSCWSADIFNFSNSTVIAAGHNGPGVSIFGFRTDDTSSPLCIASKELPAAHNIPSLTFVSSAPDKEGYATLAYASIYGSLTTIKLRLDIESNTILAKYMDSQFFGEYCWSIIPLHTDNFMKVSEFEFLNLNYQEAFKKSILYSIYEDSVVLDHFPASIYACGNFGIGTLTTQIPVPVSPISWRCRHGLAKHLELRFTSFDKESKISSAHLKTSSTSLDDAPFFVNRTSHLNTTERITLDLPPDRIKRYYVFEDENCIADSTNEEARRKNQHRKSFENIDSITSGTQLRKNQNFYSYEVANTLELGQQVQKLNVLENKSLGPIERDNQFIDHCLASAPICYSSVFFQTGDRGNLRDLSKKEEGEALLSKDCDTISSFTSTSESPASDNDLATPEINTETFRRLTFQLSQSTRTVEEDLADSKRSKETYILRHNEAERKWAVHNHAQKVQKLLLCIEDESEFSLEGFKLTEHENEFLMVTTVDNIYLVKAHPLLITSFTKDAIFPVEAACLCSRFATLCALNRINIVCHIKELNCVAVASQAGLVSLLRLTEFNGIYSFRQEYILGWKAQDPESPEHDYRCAIAYHGWAEEEEPPWYCGIDDVCFPYYNINGMTYTFVPEDKRNNIKPYAILYVVSYRAMRRFKITTGDQI